MISEAKEAHEVAISERELCRMFEVSRSWYYGQEIMISTPARPTKRYGIGAVDYHTGETIVLIRRRKRRPEAAELLEALLEKHPTGTIYVGWENSNLLLRKTQVF